MNRKQKAARIKRVQAHQQRGYDNYAGLARRLGCHAVHVASICSQIWSDYLQEIDQAERRRMAVPRTTADVVW